MNAFDKFSKRDTFKKQKKYFQAIRFLIFGDCFMFYQIFLSPQVKQWAIITYEHDIYEFPQE